MLQRLAAVFFILALAGQVLAGVCACLDEGGSSHSKMPCCLKKKAQETSVSKKKCCDAVCGQTGENLPRSHSETSVKIPIVIRKAVEKLIVGLDPKVNHAAFLPVRNRAENVSPLLSKPPVIYLQNHAFLI